MVKISTQALSFLPVTQATEYVVLEKNGDFYQWKMYWTF